MNDHDDTIIQNLRKRPRGTWSLAERHEFYREQRWHRVARIIERVGWSALVLAATALEIPMPWHAG
jgi:hypothetical protein